MNISSTDEWLYIRAYPDNAALMDAAATVLVPWLSSVAAAENADRWFFIRYLDMTGQHLRMRLHCSADGADRVYKRLPEVETLLEGLGRNNSQAERLILGSTFDSLPAQLKVNTAVYSPELEKYGGVTGVGLAERLFTYSSEWYVRGQVSSMRPRHERALLAFEILKRCISLVFPHDPTAFYASHQRKWSVHLRAVVTEKAALMSLIGEIKENIDRLQPNGSSIVDLAAEIASEVCATVAAAEALNLQLSREQLLLEYVHMEMNRLGFLPAEECVLGMMAAGSLRSSASV
jgi:thiopeptide-type bacteriocin biosynthesis protein